MMPEEPEAQDIPRSRLSANAEKAPDFLAPVLDWDDFNNRMQWRQDQHVGMIGPTESGKSTLTFHLLKKRKYIAFFATKPKDNVLAQYAKQGGFKTYREWPYSHKARNPFKKVHSPEETPKRILWPDATNLDATASQRRVFRTGIEDIYRSGGWCVVWDEFWMMTNILDLEQESRILLQQARSNNISFVMGAQRPSRIPLELYDQSTHLFFFRDNDERNLKTMSGIGWKDADSIRRFVAHLEPHQFLYINTRSGEMYRSTAPVLEAKK